MFWYQAWWSILFLHTTLIGNNVVDACKLCEYPNISNYWLAKEGEHNRNWTHIKTLAHQPSSNANRLLTFLIPRRVVVLQLLPEKQFLSPIITSPSCSVRFIIKLHKKHAQTIECVMSKKDPAQKRKLVWKYCFECNLPFCCFSKWNKDWDCFKEHVSKIKQVRGRAGTEKTGVM